MPNPTFATTPPPFDPPDAASPVYDGLSTSERARLVKIHQVGPQTWSTSTDVDLQAAGLVLKLSGKAMLAPAGCAVAIWAHYQGVAP